MQFLRITFLAVVTAICMAIIYLAFAESLGYRELIAAGVAASISTASAMVFARAGGRHYAFRWRDLAQGWRVPWNALLGTGQVLAALARQLFTAGGAKSSVRAVRFDIGIRGDPKSAGRLALAVTYATATPNFIILGIADQQELMLFHQIVPGDVRPMTQNLGARP